MPNVSFSEYHQPIDVVQLVAYGKAEFLVRIFILVTEKESKPLEKRDNGKVCAVTARHPLHTQLHTRSGLSVVTSDKTLATWRAPRSTHSSRTFLKPVLHWANLSSRTWFGLFVETKTKIY